MNKSLRVIALVSLLSGASVPGWATFSTQGKISLGASATVGASPLSTLTIKASTLPGVALFGKNAVIPVQVINTAGPISASNLSVTIVYQLFDANGATIGAPISGPITFAPDPNNRSILNGSAIISATDLQTIQHGGKLTYIFVARQSGVGTMLTSAGPAAAPGTITTLPTPFATTITDQFCNAVVPAGSRVSAPDLFVNDGQTAVALAPGAVAAPGTLCIKEEEAAGWPPGPGGSKPAAIYSISLQDTALSGTAELILSYAADASGRVLGANADPGNLGIYWLDRTNGAIPTGDWRPLSRASIDTTLHTVTGMTNHLSTFALFAAGSIGAADLRPRERIITPNGDGINDTATFSGLSAGEEVHIYDVRGRRVRTIVGPTPVWDGRDDDGHIVESGVYIYQYSSQGERVSGVIAVAK